jgi:DNA-directed RNA polymerase subunit RPC12/RpoP
MRWHDRTKITDLLRYKPYMAQNNKEDLEETKLLGSGGYAFAKLTEQEKIKANLGVPQIFLSNIGRLNEDRFTKYYCNKCAKEYHGSPVISYENPNEELGEDVILIEKGDYRCRTCSNVIALYRRFNK